MTAPYDLRGKRVWVAGHAGMVGAAIVRRLALEHCQVLTAPWPGLDLRQQAPTEAWLDRERPQLVFIAAAKVGGILANMQAPAEFLYDNLMIEANIVHGAFKAGVEKLVLLGSSCIYPKLAPQPIREDALLTGPLEPTNEWYAIAKIAGIKLCQAYRAQHGADFIAAMPSNLYGPGDNFDPLSSHVLPALMQKAHAAKLAGAAAMPIWGTGTTRREFLHVDDCADALVHLSKAYSSATPVNVGSGTDVSILELARLVGDVVGFEGGFVHDLSKPDGTPRKLMDNTVLATTGWSPRIGLREGVAELYSWFLAEAERRG